MTADEIMGESENGEDSFAAAAMVQAALNAMAYFSPVAKPLDLPPTELKPTSPIAAAMVVQVSHSRLALKPYLFAKIQLASFILPGAY